MAAFFNGEINRLVKDCARRKKEMDRIIEEYLDASNRFKNGHKRKGILLEFSIIMWEGILVGLEKELRAYPLW